MEQKDRGIDKEEIERAWKSILIGIGENPDREGLKNTPIRIAKMYKELFRGYNKGNKPYLTTFNNNPVPISFMSKGLYTDI
ncbi:hypothetical protein CMI38_02695 [Candidatus Pacearchaeota archaeon]|nr:hypothetical protein [Candidatus Pacearchaeota archaeon]|tara:strand:- start:8846 stop:9088 length:243 start_codon:yes stop_codon:yes gene_type:complete